MEKRPIIALDFATMEEVLQFLAHFPKEESLFLKVGMELFYAKGPDCIRTLRALGHDIFLDVKVHDIPNTAYHAMKSLGKLDIQMTNVHALGGIDMMHAAKEGLVEGAKTAVPKLIAVTQLTSTNNQMVQLEQKINQDVHESAYHLAKMTELSGLDGVVCSAQEAKTIHRLTTDAFLCVTPGIRLETDAIGDQKRVMTPKKARMNQADYIVVGRPITTKANPYQAYQTIQTQWSEVK